MKSRQLWRSGKTFKGLPGDVPQLLWTGNYHTWALGQAHCIYWGRLSGATKYWEQIFPKLVGSKQWSFILTDLQVSRRLAGLHKAQLGVGHPCWRGISYAGETLLVTMAEAQEDKWECARSPKAWTQNWHSDTFNPFHGPKQITLPDPKSKGGGSSLHPQGGQGQGMNWGQWVYLPPIVFTLW